MKADFSPLRQIDEARKEALKSPRIGKHGKRKATLLKQEVLKEAIRQEVLKDFIPPKFAYAKHRALLDKQEVLRKYDPETGITSVILTGQPDTQAVSQGLKMYYEHEGEMAPQKHINLNVEVAALPEVLALTEKLNAIYRSASGGGDGVESGSVDDKASDKE